MAQPASNPKIEELRFRLKTDPKSRIFYPLAEELRKIAQYAEAEQVLHTGLANHPTYLSAWVSLGRVMRDLGKNEQAVEALTKALQLDPGNVVAARILADAYMALGEKVEAIKKYKLVHALLPSDEELEGIIERLEKELHPPAPAPVETVAIPEAAPEQPAVPEQPPMMDETPWASEPEPAAAAEAPLFAATEEEQETGDDIPMSATHTESPFEEPVADFGYSADAFSLEQPGAMHVEPAPLVAELPTEVVPAEVEAEPADVFAPAEPVIEPEPQPVTEIGLASDMPFPITAELPPPAPDDFSKTITMADLYAKQGLIDEARDIYEDILARDPNNEGVRARLHALDAPSPLPGETQADEGNVFAPAPQQKIARLEGWLAKVARRESGGI